MGEDTAVMDAGELDGAAHLEARARVLRAAELVERAQHDLERACQEVSSLIGGAPDWGRISNLAVKARAEWDRLQKLSRSPTVTLDGCAKTNLMARITPARKEVSHG